MAFDISPPLVNRQFASISGSASIQQILRSELKVIIALSLIFLQGANYSLFTIGNAAISYQPALNLRLLQSFVSLAALYTKPSAILLSANQARIISNSSGGITIVNEDLPEMHIVKDTHTLCLKLTAASGSNIIQFAAFPQISIEGLVYVCSSISTNNIYAKSYIKSIDEVPLPEITDEMSPTERTYAGLNAEWDSKRIQLNFLINSSVGWINVGSVSLINTAYPFRQYDLLALYNNKSLGIIGNNLGFGFQIQDVGYGLLKDDDKVEIWADFAREMSFYGK